MTTGILPRNLPTDRVRAPCRGTMNLALFIEKVLLLLVTVGRWVRGVLESHGILN